MANSLTRDVLMEYTSYNKDTGEFVWIKRPSNRVKIGDSIGNIGSHGYLETSLLGNRYLVHRLVWLYEHGEFPDKKIDHVDRNRLNNSIANLRLASDFENAHNVFVPSGRNKNSGLRGVTFRKKINRWTAEICANGKRIYLGCFKTPEDASSEYLKAKMQLHKFAFEGVA